MHRSCEFSLDKMIIPTLLLLYTAQSKAFVVRVSRAFTSEVRDLTVFKPAEILVLRSAPLRMAANY